MPSDPEEFREQGSYDRWGYPRDSARSPVRYDRAERCGYDRSDYPQGFVAEGNVGNEFYAALTDGSDLAEAMQQDLLFSQDPWRQGVNQLQRAI
jgi:hypothetical protein